MTRNQKGGKGKHAPGVGDRGMHVKVKTAKGRTNSSTRWLARQLNDPYVRKAKMEGMRSRSTFKLMEIDDKFNLLKPGMRIIDLGCAPGGWCEVASDRVKSSSRQPLVVGIDLLPMEEIPGVRFFQKDFLDSDAPDLLKGALNGERADMVMSDMAAATTGHKQTDHLRTVHLFEVAAEFAREALVEGGVFLAKVFSGGTEKELLLELKRDFQFVKHVKPPASRKESPEMYVLACGFKGPA